MLLNLQMKKINNFSSFPCNRRSQCITKVGLLLNFERLRDLVEIRTFDCRLFCSKNIKIFCTLKFALFKYILLASQMNGVISLALWKCARNKTNAGQKKERRKVGMKGKVRWSYDKMLIDWVRSGRTGKYLALGHGARTSLRSVRTPWPRAKYFPVRPSHSVNKYIFRPCSR